jgi:hypothetical protein
MLTASGSLRFGLTRGGEANWICSPSWDGIAPARELVFLAHSAFGRHPMAPIPSCVIAFFRVSHKAGRDRRTGGSRLPLSILRSDREPALQSPASLTIPDGVSHPNPDTRGRNHCDRERRTISLGICVFPPAKVFSVDPKSASRY